MSAPTTKALAKIKPEDLPPVEIEEAQVADRAAEKALQAHGLVAVTAQSVRALAAIGSFEKGIGVVPVLRGRAMLTQERVDRALVALTRIIDGTSDKLNGKVIGVANVLRAGQVLAQIAKAQTDSLRFTLELEEHLPPHLRLNQEREPLNKTFAPGAAVKPHTTIYAKEVHIADAQNEGEEKQKAV
jgi:hypothetical protein